MHNTGAQENNKYRMQFNRLGFVIVAGLLLQGCAVTRDDSKLFGFVETVRAAYPEGKAQIKTLFPVPFVIDESRGGGEYSIRSFRIGNVIIGRTFIHEQEGATLPERVNITIDGVCITETTVSRYFPDLKWDYKLMPGPHNMYPDMYYVSRADKNSIRLRVSYPVYLLDSGLEVGCLRGIMLSSGNEKYDWD